jgi:sialate O-acetylesterase
MCKKLVVLSFVLCLASVVGADVTMPTMFTDHAVLQQGMAVPVWGTASASEQVTVDFNGQSKSTTASGSGDWMVYLDSMSASSAGADMTITGDNVVTITDVWVGEVWFTSGQSNMNFELGSSESFAECKADAANHNIRWYENALDPEWKDLSLGGAPLRKPSAVAYYFVHQLAHNLDNIAMGIYQACKPGTDITEFHTCSGAYPGGFYISKIIPMQPYAIRGAIWYQGENETLQMAKAIDYDCKLKCLIDEWRTDWGQGDFPFGIVQLHSDGGGENSDSWSTVMNHQFWVSQEVANCGLAVNWDTPHTGSPGHPKIKKPAGERLALWARAEVYNQSGFEYSGPIPVESLSSIDGSEITVGFEHVGGGLITDDEQAPSAFQVAGSDKVFYDATGEIVEDTVVLSSPSVANPESARFVWKGDIVPGNLYNVEMLPTPLFKMQLVDDPIPANYLVNPNFELDGDGNQDLTTRPMTDCLEWNGWQGSEEVVPSDHPTALMEAHLNLGDIWQNTVAIGQADTEYTLYADIKSLSGSGATCRLIFETGGDWANDEETLCVLPDSGWQEFTAVLDTTASPVYECRQIVVGIRHDATGDVAWTNVRLSVCGDGTCNPGESSCGCPEDCGPPASTESSCSDGIDNDCDGFTDCLDSECSEDPACEVSYCGDETCDPDEDQCNCSDDCGTPPSTETSCTDEIDNDCDTYIDCDDHSDCDSDPACQGCTPMDMHIEAVVCAEISCGGPNRNGRATVTIYDDCGDPVQNALVDGTFSSDFDETFYDVQTDENGVAVFTTIACVKLPSWSFKVDDVDHGTLPHDSNDDLATGCSG